MTPGTAGTGKVSAGKPLPRGPRTGALLRHCCRCCCIAALPWSCLAGDSWRPGSPDYCVTLADVEVSAGQLTPQFDGDTTDYELEVSNAQIPNMHFLLSLQMQKYEIQHVPLILVDGKKLEYTPVNIIAVNVILNKTIGAFDQTLHIEVKDPTQGSWLFHPNQKKYSFHIRQPPELQKVLRAETIVVRGQEGKEITSDPPFSPNSNSNLYFFNVSEDELSVDVQFRCSKYATHTLWEDTSMPNGIVKRIDMRERVLQRFSASCVFDDAKLPRSERDYLLEFERIVHLGKMGVHPELLPDLGYCLTRRAYLASLPKSLRDMEAKSGAAAGYVCFSDVLHPKIMVRYDYSRTQATLSAVEKPYRIGLHNSVPEPIPHSRSRHAFTLSAGLGKERKEIPVHFIWPANCSTMICPRHYILKERPGMAALAKDRLCLLEECTVNDRDTCCDRQASCSTLTCPQGKTPDAHKSCHAAECSEADQKHCCDSWEFCTSGVECPRGWVFRPGAPATYCRGRRCSGDDQDLCCVQQASCSHLECPRSRDVPSDLAQRHCHGDVCTPQDEHHCCNAVASCEGFQCPGSQMLRLNAENLTCFGSQCVSSDASRCCVENLMPEGAGSHPSRTKYIFASVEKALPDGTYNVRYDYGGREESLPAWSLRSVDSEGHSSKRGRFRAGDRVEARISANLLKSLENHSGLAKLGIATREQLYFYQVKNCWPEPQPCQLPFNIDPGDVLSMRGAMPEISSYDVTRNPDNYQLCYYDARCLERPMHGCDAGGMRPSCRFCGFGSFEACPKPFSCNASVAGREVDWSPEHKGWCCKNYDIGCPFICRWGKWGPDEVLAWGPWWSPKKKAWCCAHKGIGCNAILKPEMSNIQLKYDDSSGLERTIRHRGAAGLARALGTQAWHLWILGLAGCCLSAAGWALLWPRGWGRLAATSPAATELQSGRVAWRRQLARTLRAESGEDLVRLI